MNDGRTVLGGRGPRNLIRGALALFVTPLRGDEPNGGGGRPRFPTKACKALQAKYPGLKGKTLVDALNPHTPGYEALDPQDPEQVHRIRRRPRAGAGTMPRDSA